MKILLLGGNGFIGTHIVDRLRLSGHIVHIYDKYPERLRAPLPDVTYHIADFHDMTKLAQALEGVDVVYHLISTTVPSTSNSDPIRDVQENLVLSVRLLQIMMEQKVMKIVFLSSGGTVYGIPSILPIPETHALNPICSHAVVKIAIEHYLNMFHQLYGLSYIVVRAANPYGALQWNYGVQGIVSTIIKKAMRNDVIDIWGDGNIVRDFIYIDDLASLCSSVIDKDVIGIYNAGSGVGTSIKELINIIQSYMDNRINIAYHPVRDFDVPRIVLDISKTSDVFNWKPKMSLHKGIELTIQQMKLLHQ